MAFRDIRKSRKWLSAEEFKLLVFVLVLTAVLLALNIYLARILPGGEQFLLRWSGARAFLFDKFEPYSVTIASRVQAVAYGRTAFSSEYPYLLNDPFYIVLLYTPLAWFSNFAVARGIWMLLSEAALVAWMFFFLRSLEWEPPLWLVITLAAFSMFGYYSLLALKSGAPVMVMLFLFFIILHSLRSFSDELAGALIFLVAYQWEVSIVFFLFAIFLVLAYRRWKVFNGLGMTLVILLAVSLLAYPGWFLPYIRALISDWYRGASMTFGHIVSAWLPETRFSIGFWTMWLLGLVLFLEWLGSVNTSSRRLMWTACLSLSVTPLMGFAIFPENHVLLLPAFILITMLAWERWGDEQVLYVLLILLSAFFIPWWLYWRVIHGAPQLYVDLLRILPPLATTLGLYWMRWWAFHSPRTWLDQVGDRK